MSDRVPLGSVECIMHFNVPGQSGDVQSSMGFLTGAGEDNTEREAVVDALENLLGQVSTLVQLDHVTFDIGSADPVNAFVEENSLAFGLGGGDVLPPNVSWLIQRRTFQGGRRGRGRMFMPGVTAGSVDSQGNIDPGVVAGWSTNFDDFISDLPTGWLPALMHATAPFTPTLIAAFSPQGRVATQRKRLRD